ncbi:D-alanyl-D-alanine carboxypeptidase/D-alanyl-D-alanine-endopeptidase [Amycolatopsis antarctica]|uniref:D-alanyl-D-alanine carboxypeptidase/D-alanyl-D-alanine endopeptidase n=1 Tax=Amycolatopsis antarctica TaxID=1854586 RepID=UPI0013FE24F4|nr:D-alanyl-D-alanine carboxypeptidase/D-alanyl-D-alanine-endopeptidase [Amycolatopsis antarctica]
MPEPEGPAWPSGDSDDEQRERSGDERTHELKRPAPDLHDQPTVWAQRPSTASAPEPPGDTTAEPPATGGEAAAADKAQPAGWFEEPTSQLPLPAARDGSAAEHPGADQQRTEPRAVPGPQPGQPQQPRQPQPPHQPQAQHQPARQQPAQAPAQQQQPAQQQTPPGERTVVTPGLDPARTGQQRQAPPHEHPTQPATPPPAGTHAQPMRIEPGMENVPAAASTGEQPAASAGQDGASAAPRKRRKRTLIGSGLALLLVIAVGVVLALPAVSNRLALPWAPNAPKADPPAAEPVNLSLRGPGDTPGPTADGVTAALQGPAGNAALGTLTGSVVDPATGRTLWERDAGTPLTPASTTKLLTAAAALLSLDHGAQFSTKVVAGEQPGSAVLVAGGDVTLSSLPAGEESIYPGAAHLDELVEQVKAASGGQVSSVSLDLNAFTGQPTAPGWAPEDTPSTYMADVVPAMLDGGRSSATDGKAMRVPNPGGVLAQQLAGRLGAQVAAPVTATAPQGAKVLGEVSSAPLRELVDTMLVTSDNLLADVLARHVAIAAGKDPSFAGGAETTLQVLRDNGFDLTGVELSDGSGLSTANRVPAKLLTELLAVAGAADGADPRTAKLRPMLGGLPVAGGSGTLAGRYTAAPADTGKGWVRAKTGTLSGVNTLAGIVLDADGRPLVFALMSAGSDLGPGQAALDGVAAALRGCGCR